MATPSFCDKASDLVDFFGTGTGSEPDVLVEYIDWDRRPSLTPPQRPHAADRDALSSDARPRRGDTPQPLQTTALSQLVRDPEPDMRVM